MLFKITHRYKTIKYKNKQNKSSIIMLERNSINVHSNTFTACTANLAFVKIKNWLAVWMILEIF